jgi:hypothetical protein
MIIVERRVRLSGGELSLRVEIPDDAEPDPEGDALIAALLHTVAEFTGEGPIVTWKFAETAIESAPPDAYGRTMSDAADAGITYGGTFKQADGAVNRPLGAEHDRVVDRNAVEAAETPTMGRPPCECGDDYDDHTSGVAVGCDAMTEDGTLCPCTAYRPVTPAMGGKRPPPLSPEVRQERAEARWRGVLETETPVTGEPPTAANLNRPSAERAGEHYVGPELLCDCGKPFREHHQPLMSCEASDAGGDPAMLDDRKEGGPPSG